LQGRWYWRNEIKITIHEKGPAHKYQEWMITRLVGVDSITLYYKGVRGLSAEVFHFNQKGQVAKAYAHYTQNL